jgi:hypothetical protein
MALTEAACDPADHRRAAFEGESVRSLATSFDPIIADWNLPDSRVAYTLGIDR